MQSFSLANIQKILFPKLLPPFICVPCLFVSFFHLKRTFLIGAASSASSGEPTLYMFCYYVHMSSYSERGLQKKMDINQHYCTTKGLLQRYRNTLAGRNRAWSEKMSISHTGADKRHRPLRSTLLNGAQRFCRFV